MRYIQDRETGKLLPANEWFEKYGEVRPRTPMFIIKGNFEPYISPASGEVITTARKREQDMKAHNCVDYEPSMKAEIQQNMKREEEKLEAAVDETVERVIDAMPTRKKELLEQELNAGADLSYKRIGAEND